MERERGEREAEVTEMNRRRRAEYYSLKWKRPSQELQKSSQGLGIRGRSHLGMAPAYMVVLKELNIRCRAVM